MTMARAIVAKQSILCDGQLQRIGTTFKAAPDVAERLVSQGYAEHAPKPPKGDKSGSAKTEPKEFEEQTDTKEG